MDSLDDILRLSRASAKRKGAIANMAEILKVGTPAPDVTFRQGRESVSLQDFRGRKNVVLAFYAAAFTGG